MKEILRKEIKRALGKLGIPQGDFSVDLTEDLKNGDFTSNVAFIFAKMTKSSPRELADKIKIILDKRLKSRIERIEVAGPGFINFYLGEKVLAKVFKKSQKKNFGRGKIDRWRKILIEYTDPNPFKEFHIGHLMSNAIGESISRLLDFQGAKIIRACYQGDVGLHVAKAIWGLQKKSIPWEGELSGKIKLMGEAYTEGAKSYDENALAKQEITDLNKLVYTKTNNEVNKIYEWGRKASLEHFEEIYKTLGTKFDFYFFESEMAEPGIKIVKEFLKKGVFEESEGAVIFKGEKAGLHTRVFISSAGLPMYEAKEVALMKAKLEKIKFDQSIVVTANEQSDYFKVLMRVMEDVYPSLRGKMTHLAHGMMRFASGKMSSRTGNVISGASLIQDMTEKVRTHSKDENKSETDFDENIKKIAVGAIKFSILRSALGSDIIFDPDQSLSIHGDSGAYLQYTSVRTRSIVLKAETTKLKANPKIIESVKEALRHVYRFPFVLERARQEFSPNLLANYLIELASAYNRLYSKETIVNDSKDSGSLLALNNAVRNVLENGLWVLGIEIVEKM